MSLINRADYPFLTDFRVMVVAEGNLVNAFELESDFIVFSEVLGAQIRVPKGFQFDGESIPACLTWLVRPVGKSRRGACVHDYLYRYAGWHDDNGTLHPVTRSQADAVYRNLLKAKGLSAWRASTRWSVLRIVGWAAWRGNRSTHGSLLIQSNAQLTL
jgi:hypothetical protein